MLTPNLVGLAPSGLQGQIQPSPRVIEGHTTSVLALAQAKLADFQSDALDETQESLGFALGGRLRTQRRGKDDETGVRGRVLMHKLVAEIAMVDQIEIIECLDDGEWQQSSQLLPALLAKYPEPGAAALQLAAWLAYGQQERKLRTKMERALSSLMADEDCALSLFGVLEFGVVTPGLRQELVRLYHRASEQHQRLSQWLAQLGERSQRRRKIRTMLRLLSYELSASGQPIVGSHLSAVIGDLRQLLRLLGLEMYCDQASEALGIPDMNGDKLMGLVVQLLEQVWVNADMLEEILPPLSALDYYRMLHALGKLFQLLPEECFNDSDHLNLISDAIVTLRDKYIT